MQQANEKPLLLNNRKIYYYESFFSEIKPLEHYKKFTFYIVQKIFF